jgi:hypothetical protein
MKAFIIVSGDSQPKNGMLVSMLSTFVSIESIGIAKDVVEAVALIRQRYPNTVIFNSRLLEEKEYGYLAHILEHGGSFLMLPKHLQFKDRCTYIGIDFSVAEQKKRILNKIGETLHEYRHFAAK